MPDRPVLPPHALPTADPAPPGVTLSAAEPAGSTADATTPGDTGTAPLAPVGYELHGEIGRGGMGAVYRAHDQSLNRDVAVKILQDRYTPTSLAGRRFLDEARITGQLQHPGIPPVHQLGVLPDGRPFIAMKLIKGRTLAEDLAAGALARGAFVSAFEQVCQAVAYAHSHGVIHRDLKPANVMVGAFGEVQVMDWGLAKFRGEARATATETATASTFYDPRDDTDEGSRTRAGSFLGTPAYMAPEQAIGAIDRIDERTDVFGLGGVLCAILTGAPPFAGGDPESTRQLAAQGKVEEAHARLDGCGAEPELITLCKRCLSADPAGRPRDAGEVARAVADLRAAADERARKAELDRAAAEARTAEQRKRRRVQTALGVTFTALVLLGGAFAWWQDKQAADRRTELARIENEQRIQQEKDENERLLQKERDRSAAAAALAAARAKTATSVSAALDDAKVRTEAAWALSDEPDKMRVATDLALAAVRRAEGFAAGGEPTPALLAELAATGRTVTDLDQHTRFLVLAEDALFDYDAGATKQNTGERMTAAIREFGWDTATTSVEEAADNIAASRIRDKVLGLLRNWKGSGQGAAANSAWGRNVLRLARLRSGGLLARWQEAIDKNDTAEIIAIADDPASLELGPELIVAIAADLRRLGDHARELAVLRKAAERYPKNMWVNYDAGYACDQQKPPLRAEGLRYYAAAAAVRPTNAFVQANLGYSLLNNNAPVAALATFRTAVRLAPNYARAQSGLGAALARAGNSDEAIAILRESLRLQPGSAAALLNLADALKARGDTEEARATYRQVSQSGSATAAQHNSAGVRLHELKDNGGAIAAYKAAVGRDPKYVIAHANLGNALRQTGDPDGAIASYKEAIRIDPKYVNAHGGLGFALYAKGDLDGAIAALKEAIRIDPNYKFAHAHLGDALKAKGDLDGAIAAYQEATRLNPTSAHLHNELGYARLQKRDFAGAIPPLEIAIRIDPKHVHGHVNLGSALRGKGDLGGAIAKFKQAIAIDPNSEFAHSSLGSALRAKGDVDGAIVALKEAVRLYPKYTVAHHELGLARQTKGDLDGAIAAFEEAVRLDPKFAPAHITLGAALRDKGDRDGAVAALKTAVRLAPKDPRAHFELAITLQTKGDLEGAIAKYKEAIVLEPKVAIGHNNLAWLLAVGPDRVRDGKLAVEHATRACELSAWKEFGFIDTLAAACAEAGDFDKAVEHQKKVLSFPATEKAEGPSIRRRLELYSQKKPYRDPVFAPREVAPAPRPVNR